LVIFTAWIKSIDSALTGSLALHVQISNFKLEATWVINKRVVAEEQKAARERKEQRSK
jgi:hypothetical protein